MTINTLKQTFIILILSISLGSSQNPCGGKDFRAFDFWLGDWEVFNPEGKLVGTSNISIKLDSCMVYESWSGKGPYKGNSMNYFDRNEQIWKQKWLDNFAVSLEFEGLVIDNQMSYKCSSIDPKTRDTVYNIMTITKLTETEVKQVWKQSRDNEAWKVVFDGLYKRVRKDKSIAEVYKTFSKAYDTKDGALVGNLYLDNAYYLKPSGITVGSKAIVENFTDFFKRLESRNVQPKIEFKIIDRQIDSKLATDIGYYLLTYLEKDGKISQHSGRFTTTLLKGKDGRWKFLSDSYIDCTVEDYQNVKPIK